MNRITIDLALWLSLLAGTMQAGHVRLKLHTPPAEPKPVLCVFCK